MILFCVCLAHAGQRGVGSLAAAGVAHTLTNSNETENIPESQKVNNQFLTKTNLMMKTHKLKFHCNYADFCREFVEPFHEGYDASVLINKFWEKYTLQETMLNLYQILYKTKDCNKDYPLFKEDADTFMEEIVRVIVAHYFFFLVDFTDDYVYIPINKSFDGAIYPGRKGFIEELYAVFDFGKEESTT